MVGNPVRHLDDEIPYAAGIRLYPDCGIVNIDNVIVNNAPAGVVSFAKETNIGNARFRNVRDGIVNAGGIMRVRHIDAENDAKRS